jgi:hypothetical protein
MTKRKRAERRASDREQAKLARDLEKLARAAPGGGPDRAIPIVSASEVEVHAQGMPCPICRSAVRVEEHAAETVNGLRLRVARVVCSMCRARRAIYFQLKETTLYYV